MIHTISDDMGRAFLILPVTGEFGFSDPHSPDEVRWRVHVSDPASPLAGLCVSADTLIAARDRIAAAAWMALRGGELDGFGVEAPAVAGVHVLLTTPARYDVDALEATMEGAA